MNLESCEGCGRPVIGLVGQFAKLDSYFLSADSAAGHMAGVWHARCLQEAPYAEQWYEARLDNFTRVRGYEVAAELERWSVIRHPRADERLAFSRDGLIWRLTFDGDQRSRAPGGSIHRVEEREFNLELDDEAAIRTIQDSLRATKKFPVLGLFDLLGIADRVVHPEALTDAAFVWTRPLAKLWQRTWVSARCEYGVFVPAELEPYVSRKKPGAGGG